MRHNKRQRPRGAVFLYEALRQRGKRPGGITAKGAVPAFTLQERRHGLRRHRSIDGFDLERELFAIRISRDDRNTADDDDGRDQQISKQRFRPVRSRPGSRLTSCAPRR